VAGPPRFDAAGREPAGIALLKSAINDANWSDEMLAAFLHAEREAGDAAAATATERLMRDKA